MQRVKSALCISAIASAALPAHLYLGSPFPIFPFIVGLLSYPIVVVWTDVKNQYLDTVFVALFSTTVAFLLAYGSSHPVGYNDVYRHLEFARAVGPSINHGVTISHTFPALYELTFTLSSILSVSTELSAQTLTGTLYAGTVLLFYVLIARRFLPRSRSQLAAVVLFASNWGVFRFMIEYRTLNLSLAAGVFFLGALVSRRSDRRWSICAILGVVLLGISQLATLIFISLIGFCYALSRLELTGSRPIRLIAIGSCSVIAFLMLIGTYDTVVGGIANIISNHILPQAPDSTGSPIENAASMPYGPRVYLLDWLERGLIGIAIITVTLLTAVSRNRDYLFLVLSGGSVGVILSVSFVTGFALLPPRIFTFFAIPSALIVGVTIELVDNLPDRRVRQVGYGIAIFLILLTLSLSMVKIPGYVVGDTQPLRGDAPVDNDNSFKFDQSDLAQLNFVESYVTDGVSDGRGRFSQHFYANPQNPDYFFTLEGDASCHKVYDTPTGSLLLCRS